MRYIEKQKLILEVLEKMKSKDFISFQNFSNKGECYYLRTQFNPDETIQLKLEKETSKKIYSVDGDTLEDCADEADKIIFEVLEDYATKCESDELFPSTTDILSQSLKIAKMTRRGEANAVITPKGIDIPKQISTVVTDKRRKTLLMTYCGEATDYDCPLVLVPAEMEVLNKLEDKIRYRFKFYLVYNEKDIGKYVRVIKCQL